MTSNGLETTTYQNKGLFPSAVYPKTAHNNIPKLEDGEPGNHFSRRDHAVGVMDDEPGGERSCGVL